MTGVKPFAKSVICCLDCCQQTHAGVDPTTYKAISQPRDDLAKIGSPSLALAQYILSIICHVKGVRGSSRKSRQQTGKQNYFKPNAPYVQVTLSVTSLKIKPIINTNSRKLHRGKCLRNVVYIKKKTI